MLNASLVSGGELEHYFGDIIEYQVEEATGVGQGPRLVTNLSIHQYTLCRKITHHLAGVPSSISALGWFNGNFFVFICNAMMHCF